MTNSDARDFDIAMMDRVIALAEQGRCTAAPNPMVGCIITLDGDVVGEGYHERAGSAHAERMALSQAGDRARGATVYVNLEPCCHQGRTPPCTDALIDAGVSRVVAAMPDPNPLVAGGGFELLSRAGIETECGIQERKARWLNRGFVSRMSYGRPWIKVKLGATLDGCTADHGGVSQWITSEASRQNVQQERAQADAIVTGIGTILADDARLTARVEQPINAPLRVILDSQLRLPINASVLNDDAQVLLMTSVDAKALDADKVSEFESRGVEVLSLPLNERGQLELSTVFDQLAKWQINYVLVEAGQTLCGALLEHDLIDELSIYYGPSVLGSTARRLFATEHAIVFDERPRFEFSDTQLLGPDVHTTAVRVDWRSMIGLPK